MSELRGALCAIVFAFVTLGMGGAQAFDRGAPKTAVAEQLVAATFSERPETVCRGDKDDAVVLNRAIAAANEAGGLRVLFPRGTCRLASPLIPLSFGTRVICAGPFATVLEPISNMAAIVRIARRQAGVFDCGFLDAAHHANSGIEIAKDHDDIAVYVRGNFLRGLKIGIVNASGDFPDIEFNTCLDCGWAIKIADDATGGIVANNYAAGGEGLFVTRGKDTTEKLTLANNQMISTGRALYVTHCLYCVFNGNTLTQQKFAPNTSAMTLAAGPGDLKSIVMRDNFVGAAAGAPPKTCAAFVRDVFNFVSSGDSFVTANSTNNGLCIDHSVDVHISQPIFDRTVPGSIDIRANRSADLTIDHAAFYAATSLVTDDETYGRMDASSFNNRPVNKPLIRSGRFYVGAQSSGLTTRSRIDLRLQPNVRSATFEHGVWKTPDPSQIRILSAGVYSFDVSKIRISSCNDKSCSLFYDNSSVTTPKMIVVVVDVSE